MCEMIKTRNFAIAFLLILSVMICTLFTGCRDKSVSQQSTTQTITDHAGRALTIPAQINKCYYTSPLGMIMIYSLAPDKMVGWSMQLTDKEKKYIPDKYHSLPFLGGLQMNGKINTEELLKAKPDVIFAVGPDALTDTTKSDADKLQEQLNIPVIVVDGDIKSTEKAYTFIGRLLGVGDKAKELASYCNKTMNEVTEATQAIPEEKRAKVYYAEGPKGLATEPKGGSHALVLDLVNGNNVAQVEAKGGSGMSSVSMEQVLKWNPDVILAWGADAGGAYDLIRTSQDWANINAVKNNKVYEIPNYPFNWFDRPPSVNRFLGLKWLAATLYPDTYKVDMVSEVKNFYSLFYHVDLSDADARELLKNSGLKVN
ncbi:iron-enterobactin transporter periplasmic binding protein [Pelotomaculum sp. FP]|nr:iron-enterobactin transporter periplasmic binding protein [Pelotomaculum sp. FP]